MNIMEICVGGNWLCARNGPWRFPGNFLIWILATLLFQNLSQHTPFPTPILPAISISHHQSFQSPNPYSILHMGCTRPPWAATQVTMYSYSRLDPTPGSSPGCSCVSSRAQGLRRNYKSPNSHILSLLVTVVSLSLVI